MTDPPKQAAPATTSTTPPAATTAGPEQPLADLLTSLPCVVATVAEDLTVVYVNEAITGWREVPPRDLVGRHLAHMVGVRSVAVNRAHIGAALTGLQQRFEHTVHLPSGVPLHTQIDLMPMLRDGSPSGFHLLVTDISDRVVAEASLEAAITQAALLEERSRIAADMHDRVIQHLYAAGLGARSAARSPQGAADYVEAISICVDNAIRELRVAIRKLTHAPEPASLAASLAPITRSVARWLGHDPIVRTHGGLRDLPPELGHDLLLALTRMLAAVALRDGVRDVWIDLDVGEHATRVIVTDDGRTPAAPSIAGTLGDLHRSARGWGGAFTLQPRRPRGTVMEWSVPIDERADPPGGEHPGGSDGVGGLP